MRAPLRSSSALRSRKANGDEGPLREGDSPDRERMKGEEGSGVRKPDPSSPSFVSSLGSYRVRSAFPVVGATS
ncbi:hypothetical protein RvY_16644 [Ramazzottius varieornatus]|uniref:Uncharacterized protein n=1 Tax=Ramazzottius varieornatus TaxID=947166 RepID=A0A1D1W6M0_RAMVA|nr:hypothetical protein RvY_16644 [Ramazzottius varieornatus]